MKNLPKEFILTNFDVKEGNEVLQYHGFGDRFNSKWNYIIINENNYNVTDYEHHLPDFTKISYKEWKELVSQTFPEKWYIDVTSENIGVLSKWRRINQSVAGEQFFNTENGARLYSHDVSGDLTWFDISPLREYSQYVEITFEQFKKFVLKEDIVEIHAHMIDIIQLRELYNNANKDGKEFLEKLFKGCDVFWELFYLNNVDIDFLRGNCNKEVVTKIFGEVIDFDKLQVGSKVELKDGTIGRIVILKSEWFIGTVHNELFKNGEQSYTTIITEQNNFIHYYQDKFLTEIKHVIEY